MKKVDTLSSLEGRKLLQEIFKEMRYEKQIPSLSCMFRSWRICVHELDLSKYTKQKVSVNHKLGFFHGTGLWMEEIINRNYFSTINSFVYLGAAILLALIGIRNFSDYVSNTAVIAGVAFEALMLIFIFLVMLFTPSDDFAIDADEDKNGNLNEIINEVGEIGRDFAAASVQLEKLGDLLASIARSQEQLINQVEEVSKSALLAVSPNPQLINTMRETNESLIGFTESVRQFTAAADNLKHEEIEKAVRREVEKFLVDKTVKS